MSDDDDDIRTSSTSIDSKVFIVTEKKFKSAFTLPEIFILLEINRQLFFQLNIFVCN